MIGAWRIAGALQLAVYALTVTATRNHAHVYEARFFHDGMLSAAERDSLSNCPCANHSDCLPVELVRPASNTEPRKQVFAFSVATDDRWKHYDWDKVTTIAWNTDKELLCHAHSKGVKVVTKHNFDSPDQLCEPEVRREWIRATYQSILDNYADGVNIDTEAAMLGREASCMSQLVRELRVELNRHALTAKAQITFDVPWAPRPIDGRYYEWKELADAVDYFFVMSYDMRSQIYYQCIGAANSPLMLVKQGLDEFRRSYWIPARKLILGVPWYGYKYECLTFAAENEICTIKPTPFHGAPCSDAAGSQIDYGDVRALLRQWGEGVRSWDLMTESPYLVYQANDATGTKRWYQLWYDDPESLTLKYELVKYMQLAGVGMWNADTLDYTHDRDGARRMWQALGAIY